MRQRIHVIILVSSVIFMLVSCTNTETVPAPSVLAVIKSDTSLAIFSLIENRSGDDNLVNNSLAVIAPVDSAFVSAGITVASVPNLRVSKCDSIIKYYTIPTGVSFNNYINTETPLTSNLGNYLFADSSLTHVYFNGVPAISSIPYLSGTSALYKVTKTINVPLLTATQIISADTGLSLFAEAFKITNLDTRFTNGAYTLFMPINSAFITAGYPTIGSIDSANTTTLNQVLLYLTIGNINFVNDLSVQSSLTTLLGANVQVNYGSNGLQLVGNTNPNYPAQILNSGQLSSDNVQMYKLGSIALP